MAQRVKHLTAMWKTWVRSLGQEDTLEKEMTTHSGTLAWKIPQMEEPGRLQFHRIIKSFIKAEFMYFKTMQVSAICES